MGWGGAPTPLPGHTAPARLKCVRFPSRATPCRMAFTKPLRSKPRDAETPRTSGLVAAPRAAETRQAPSQSQTDSRRPEWLAAEFRCSPLAPARIAPGFALRRAL